MIEDRTGSIIVRSRFGDDGKRVDLQMRVIAWDDDGCPMVMGNKGLARADRYSDFKVVREGVSDALSSIVAAPPGWRVEMYDGAKRTGVLDVAAFGLTASGKCRGVG